MLAARNSVPFARTALRRAVPGPFKELTDKAGKTLPGICKQFLHYLTSSAAAITPTAYAASETVFFTGSLYLGAAGVRRSRYAVPVSLAAYAVGVLAAALVVR